MKTLFSVDKFPGVVNGGGQMVSYIHNKIWPACNSAALSFLTNAVTLQSTHLNNAKRQIIRGMCGFRLVSLAAFNGNHSTEVLHSCPLGQVLNS